MGADTDAARAQVVANRAALLEEVQRLEASARAAVDIPAKVRRAPAKTAGLAAGTAFVALGGPQRLFRRARRAVRGPEAEFPKSLLPKDIEKVVQRMGPDGDRVRGTLEREFVRYLDERSKVRRQADTTELVTRVTGNILRPVSWRFGKQLAERLFSPESAEFDKAMAKVRQRYAAMASPGADPGSPGPASGASGASADRPARDAGATSGQGPKG